MEAALLLLLTAFVLVPSANYHAFNGLPLDSLPTYFLFLAIVPVVGWRWLRHQGSMRAGSRGARHVKTAIALLSVGVVLKATLFLGGGFDGFAACYRSLDEAPRSGLCERSFGNPLGRFQATRLDRTIDFGPTDWNLSFVNDNRFNYYNWIEGTIPRERLPFSAHWRGTLSHATPRQVRVTYLGAAELRIGTTEVRLDPSHDRPRTVELTVPAGSHRLLVAYTYDDQTRIGPEERPEDRLPVATFRMQVVTPSGAAPLTAAPPPGGWRTLGRAVDLLSLGVVLALGWLYGPTVAGRWPVLVAAAGGAWFVHAGLVDVQILTTYGTFLLALLPVAVVALSQRQRKAAFLAAYAGIAVLVLTHELAAADSLRSVAVRGGGTDALTYESLAREVLDTGSLRGGEDVFYYQPLYRYIRFTEHLLFGDGDVLVSAFAQTSLILSVLWMIWTFRVDGLVSQIASYAATVLLLGLVSSVFVVDLVRLGHSEYPTWIAFPLFFTLLYGPGARHPVQGTSLAGLALITRINQAPGILWLVGVRLATLAGRRAPGVALAVVVLCGIGLLPAAHNLYYGGELVFTTEGLGTAENLAVQGADARPGWGESFAAMTAQLGRVLYDTVLHEGHPQNGGGLRPLFRGPQVLWVLAVLSLFVSLSVRTAGAGRTLRVVTHLPRRIGDLPPLLTVAAPLFFLAPHVVYWAITRHLFIGYLAMVATALYAVGVVRPYLQRGGCPPGARLVDAGAP